jgi:hypothetical protein
MTFRKSKLRRIIVTLLAILWMAACSSAASSAGNTPATTPALPPSMKGYELYSWQTDGDWHFTLMTGTNRVKTLEEITTGADTVTTDGWVRVSVRGVDALKQLLGRLPPDETIVWIGRQQLEQTGVEPGAIQLPPQETIDSISETCQQLQLELLVSDNPGGTGGSAPADFALTVDARRAGDPNAQHVAIRIDAGGAGEYDIYDSGGVVHQDQQDRVIYGADQVIDTGSLALDAAALGRLWKAIGESRFFDLTGDYRMQIGLSYAFIAVQAGGRRHQVFNIGMEVPAIREIIETVDTLLPEGIGVEYGEGYVP